MNIQVNKDYCIVSDALNVTVQRKYLVDPTKSPNWPKMQAEGKSPDIRIDWRDYKYFARVDDALVGIFEQQVRDSQAGSVAELLAEIKGFRREKKALMSFEG